MCGCLSVCVSILDTSAIVREHVDDQRVVSVFFFLFSLSVV